MSMNPTASEQLNFLPALANDDLPIGYSFGHLQLGIRSDRDDCAIIVSDHPATAAVRLTVNAVKAAPVLYCQKLRDQHASMQAIVINSGNANACTGTAGDSSVSEAIDAVVAKVGCLTESVWPMSTGVIGRVLPEGIFGGIHKLKLRQDVDGFVGAAKAIMTTDTQPKVSTRTVLVAGSPVKVCAMGKGAGMIHPSLATMLVWIGTDAKLSQATANTLLQQMVDGSFNCISVDGDQSTNDTVLFTANGASGVAVDDDQDALQALQQACLDVCQDLAKWMVLDGEGAGHAMEITVSGARDGSTAQKIARAIGNSSLVKTAIFGRDPNWGRIAAAAGAADTQLDPAKMVIMIAGVVVFKDGVPVAENQLPRISEALRDPWVPIDLQFADGAGSSRFWASDLTYEYVRINAEYTT